MYTRFVFVAAVIAACAGAQGFQRRAEFTGGGSADRGKCRIEVVVDGAAEVEIRGESATLRDLNGQAPQWRRFTCTGPMPANPVDFRFAGVDGRGRQQLVRDPRNGGAAVVRIEDPEGGAQAYTFELVWGGSGYPAVQDRGRVDPQDPRRYDPQEPRRYDPQDNNRQRDGNWDARNQRDRQVNRRYSIQQAVQVCQDAVKQQAFTRFRTRSIVFGRTAMDDNPGRNDWVMGTFDVRRGYRGGQDSYRFSCSVNFDTGQVRSAQIDPMNGGYGNRGYVAPGGQAMESCKRAVEQHLREDGFERAEFGSINMDDRPGRNDWIVGNARANGREGPQAFSFSCSVNLENGSVRSVDVTHR